MTQRENVSWVGGEVGWGNGGRIAAMSRNYDRRRKHNLDVQHEFSAQQATTAVKASMTTSKNINK